MAEYNRKGIGGRRFQSHVLENIEQYPDAQYWRNSAMSAKAEVYELCPSSLEAHVGNVLDQVWSREFSWLDIFRQTEIMLNFLETHQDVLRQDTITEKTEKS